MSIHVNILLYYLTHTTKLQWMTPQGVRFFTFTLWPNHTIKQHNRIHHYRRSTIQEQKPKGAQLTGKQQIAWQIILQIIIQEKTMQQNTMQHNIPIHCRPNYKVLTKGSKAVFKVLSCLAQWCFWENEKNRIVWKPFLFRFAMLRLYL